MEIRDRIVELRRVKASELLANPHNWREHPEPQRDALRGVLAEIGYANALLARELDDGRLELIDGHLRAEETPDMEVPVLILDVDEEEAAKLLAVIDPLTELAEANEGELRKLLEGTHAEDASFREYLEQLARSLPDEDATDVDEAAGKAAEGMNLRPHEHYDYVVVLARTTQEWNRLAEALGLEKIKLNERGKVGYGRGYAAAKLLELLKPAEAPKKPRRGRKKK